MRLLSIFNCLAIIFYDIVIDLCIEISLANIECFNNCLVIEHKLHDAQIFFIKALYSCLTHLCTHHNEHFAL